MSAPTATRHQHDAATSSGGAGAFTGTAALVRFNLRRDRIRIPLWTLGILAMSVGTGSSYPALYPTAADRQAQAEIMTGNPAMAVMSGPGYGAQDYTYGAMLSNEILGFVAVLVALMSVLLVVRHTRAEEESDRAELVRATVVGRHAHLTAAVAAVSVVNVLIGALVAVGFASLGIDSVTWVGSLSFGLALASVGMVFTGVAAVTAQVFGHARAASGAAGALIGLAYALRAAGDMGYGELSWASPIGWAQQTRAYVDERWWPLLLALAAGAALLAAAYTLSTRRDVGAGLIDQRPGPAAASDSLVNPLGFALRLQRGSLIGWVAAMALFGLAYGSSIGVIADYADNELIQEMLAAVGGASMVEQFLSMIISLLAMVCTIYMILAAVRLRSEETVGRAEPVLATGLSRTRWMASHLVVAFIGGALVLLASALALGASAAAVEGDAGLIAPILGAALAYLPAMWLTAGLAVAIFGLLPRVIALAWAILVYAIAIGYFGALLRLPDWLMDLSPFGHVPRLPGEELTVLPLVVLTLLAAALVTVGVVGFSRRDLETT